ncbi:hypothetical protein [Lysinibacillus sp.]|uniref:hypothetical protein n=1 Tax=Lysinibacillus sp. TaxID=1869345 RepID=UPI0028976FBB|nr:hypothetical protein [Lysinibacillus sp.]
MSRYDEQLETLLTAKAQGKGVNVRILEAGLDTKIKEGTLEHQDLEVAAFVARSLGSMSSRVKYSQIRRALESKSEEQAAE